MRGQAVSGIAFLVALRHQWSALSSITKPYYLLHEKLEGDQAMS